MDLSRPTVAIRDRTLHVLNSVNLLHNLDLIRRSQKKNQPVIESIRAFSLHTVLCSTVICALLY